jgi:1-phosphofructokinase
MIVTLTPNPSLDRTVEIDRLVRGEVIRVRAAHVEPGGKGVNVARALVLNDVKARAILPSGGAEGAQLVSLLPGESIEPVVVPISGTVRSNVAVVEPDGTTTKLNEPGPRLSAVELDALVATTHQEAVGAEWVVLSGSLPPGAPDDFYARIVRDLTQSTDNSARVVVDSSGPALVEAVGAGPHLVKPNHEELAEATGREVHTLGDAVEAAQELRRRGAATVLVSLGKNGALLVDADGVFHGESPATPRSTVGAGDAFLAGFLAGGGAGISALSEALAYGAAATSLPGSQMPGPSDLDRAAVRLHDSVDLNRSL